MTFYANVFTHKHRAFLSLSTVTAFCLNFILILNQVFLLKCNTLLMITIVPAVWLCKSCGPTTRIILTLSLHYPRIHIIIIHSLFLSPVQELEVGLLSSQTDTSGWRWTWGGEPKSLLLPRRAATAALIGSRPICWCSVTQDTTGDNTGRKTA